ncbi:MAG TPA: anthranilate phosphoribosyltransferase [Candidatus Altiarchaeales archaeon]|nr:anthranilate phosphoribosyltransferase [Candidatus Altiarchaeales archaeon]
MKNIIQKIMKGRNLTEEEAEGTMKTIMSGKAKNSQIAAFLTAMRMKGETPEEIAAFAIVMRDFAFSIKPRIGGCLVDMCGTGGDNLNTFNISTTAMFIVAGAGISVAKHGNRSITSNCGSADVLEELGINLNLEFEKIQECIERVGIGFMFAPSHHSAMKHVMPVRRELGFRTVFNILGPLTNPAFANSQLMGVFDPDLTEKLAKVFKILGSERAMVVHGRPGMDEISTCGKTKISEFRDGKVKTYFIKPEDFGIKRARIKELIGGLPRENARILKEILNCECNGAKPDIALMNAAAGILVGEKADNLEHGLEIARETLENGKAYKKLNELIEFAK